MRYSYRRVCAIKNGEGIKMPIFVIKKGVKLHGLTPYGLIQIQVAVPIFNDAGVDAVLTSACDGDHGPGSKHRVGNATDWRTRHLPGGSVGPAARAIAEKLRGALSDDFDVVLESNHIHIEYDPNHGAG